jgi:hypothetical protein
MQLVKRTAANAITAWFRNVLTVSAGLSWFLAFAAGIPRFYRQVLVRHSVIFNFLIILIRFVKVNLGF